MENELEEYYEKCLKGENGRDFHALEYAYLEGIEASTGFAVFILAKRTEALTEALRRFNEAAGRL